MIVGRKISKSYKTPVLKSVDLSCQTGMATFLMGGNGAGKTTLFKCLLGLEPFQGSFSFDGLPIAQMREKVFAIFDDDPLYPSLNGYCNVEMLLNSRIRNDVVEAAWRFGARQSSVDLLKRPVRTYSSGQRKRLQLSAAIICKPTYLILDEVASGLDVETMDAAIRMILALKSEATIIASGHQFDFYARFIDRQVMLKDGRLIEIEGDEEIDAEFLERTYRSYNLQTNSP